MTGSKKLFPNYLCEKPNQIQLKPKQIPGSCPQQSENKELVYGRCLPFHGVWVPLPRHAASLSLSGTVLKEIHGHTTSVWLQSSTIQYGYMPASTFPDSTQKYWPIDVRKKFTMSPPLEIKNM